MEEEGGIVARVDAQAHATPFQQTAFAGDEVFDLAYRMLRLATDQVVAEMQPKLLRPVGKSDRAGDGVVAVHRLLQEADDVVSLSTCKNCRFAVCCRALLYRLIWFSFAI